MTIKSHPRNCFIHGFLQMVYGKANEHSRKQTNSSSSFRSYAVLCILKIFLHCVCIYTDIRWQTKDSPIAVGLFLFLQTLGRTRRLQKPFCRTIRSGPQGAVFPESPLCRIGKQCPLRRAAHLPTLHHKGCAYGCTPSLQRMPELRTLRHRLQLHCRRPKNRD